jgi:hypothetical protein
MKRTAYILTIVILILNSCVTESVETRFRNELPALNDLTKIVLDNFNQVYNVQKINYIKDSVENANGLIEQLENNLNLTNIELHHINGDSLKIGIAYEFQHRVDKDIKYYMVYSENPENSETFSSYEQFVDFRTKKININTNWTYSEIHIYHD